MNQSLKEYKKNLPKLKSYMDITPAQLLPERLKEAIEREQYELAEYIQNKIEEHDLKGQITTIFGGVKDDKKSRFMEFFKRIKKGGYAHNITVPIKPRAHKHGGVIDTNSILTPSYLMELHGISIYEAMSLCMFCFKKGIAHKECYGDGSIMFNKWR